MTADSYVNLTCLKLIKVVNSVSGTNGGHYSSSPGPLEAQTTRRSRGLTHFTACVLSPAAVETPFQSDDESKKSTDQTNESVNEKALRYIVFSNGP